MAGKVSPGGSSSGTVAGAAPTSAASGGAVIGGSLNFSGGGGNMFSGGLAGLAADYSSAYNSALAANQQNYNNILSGYQQLASNQAVNQQGIAAGYSQLNTGVLNGLQGANASNLQSINDQYAAQMGTASQNLTSAGLNNTTVASAVQRGVNLDQAKATTASNNQFANTIAGYQSSLGLSSLDYLNQANQQQVGLGTDQLNWMNSVNVPYPDASAYTQLASMYGQQAQQDKYMDMMSGLMGTQSPQQLGGGFSGVYGTQPVPNYASGVYSGGATQGTNPGTSLTNPGASSYGTPSSWSNYEYNSPAGAALGGYGGYDLGYYSAGGYDSSGYGGGGNF